MTAAMLKQTPQASAPYNTTHQHILAQNTFPDKAHDEYVQQPEYKKCKQLPQREKNKLPYLKQSKSPTLAPFF